MADHDARLAAARKAAIEQMRYGGNRANERTADDLIAAAEAAALERAAKLAEAMLVESEYSWREIVAAIRALKEGER